MKWSPWFATMLALLAALGLMVVTLWWMDRTKK